MKRLVIAIQSLLSKKKLTGERVFLRPPKRRDALKWQKLRMSSKSFLVPWEPSWDASSCTRRTYLRYFKNSNYLANMDRAYSFLIFKTEDKTLLGGINVGNVRRGVAQSASLGYWIGEKHSRNGYMKEALKLLIPSLFIDLRLNRIERVRGRESRDEGGEPCGRPCFSTIGISYLAHTVGYPHYNLHRFLIRNQALHPPGSATAR